ncbi:hypothetical protein [Haloplanus aerogenes]|uniref:Uncharacterized protein n=1 Tax=Haloplanus aerogenes TaxID=660522 RepID=A0A3M0DAJ9_9EURY|nr:hypothetical protein [Haloplanus aerogenes]AZH26163.1 hypothetical protein DU502_12685 [Haloplanus aerogenes]RMB18384.1 hypothetical protein ATH50_1839 [Haloplanus aerogenes]
MDADADDDSRGTTTPNASGGGVGVASVGTPDPVDGSTDYDPERLCYAGERVVERAPLGAGWAAVTTHRILAYNPTADGQRFEAVDRPNVSDVRVDADGDGQFLGWGLRAAVYGLAGLGGGVALRAMDLQSTLSMDASAGAAPVGSVLAVTDALAAALALLTTVLLVGGVALLVGALVLLGRYLRTRKPALVVERFGDDPVRLSAPQGDGERAARALSTALERADGTRPASR